MRFMTTLALPACFIIHSLFLFGCGSETQPQADDQKRPPPTIVLRPGDQADPSQPSLTPSEDNEAATSIGSQSDDTASTAPVPLAPPSAGTTEADPPSSITPQPPPTATAEPQPNDGAVPSPPEPIQRVEGPVATGARGTYYLAEVARSRNIAQRTESANRLRNLAIALQGFEMEFNRHPRSLDELVDHNPAMSVHLVSPADRETRFVYLAPADARPQASAILAYDPTLYPGQTINVLTGSGTIERMSRDDLEAALERQQPKAD